MPTLKDRPEKIFRCVICGELFLNPKIHIRKKHGAKYPYRFKGMKNKYGYEEVKAQ